MICLLGKLTVRKDAEAEFETVVRELTRQVRANEPDVHIYQFAKGDDDDGVYHVMEAYASEAALASHMQSPHLGAAMEKMKSLLTARPELQKLTGIVAD
jgi:quinol monooxygenase YgiN